MIAIIRSFLIWLAETPDQFWYIWLPFGFFSGYIYEVMHYYNSNKVWPRHVDFLTYDSDGFWWTIKKAFLFVAVVICSWAPVALLWAAMPPFKSLLPGYLGMANFVGHLLCVVLYWIVMDPFGLVAWIRRPADYPVELLRTKRS